MSKPSEAIRRRQAHVQAFVDGLTGLLNCCVPEAAFFGGQALWRSRPGHEDEVNRRYGALNLIAGPAAIAVDSVGVSVAFKPAGTMQRQPMNPVLPWTTLFSDNPLLDANLIISQCQLAIGLLDAEAVEAEADEATVAGRIEHRLAAPRRIKRAVLGAPRDARRHMGATLTGAIATVVLGVVAIGIAHVWFHWG